MGKMPKNEGSIEIKKVKSTRGIVEQKSLHTSIYCKHFSIQEKRAK